MKKKNAHTTLAANHKHIFGAHFAGKSFCLSSLLPLSLRHCLLANGARNCPLVIFYFILYFVYFFLAFEVACHFCFPFFTRTPLGVSSSGSLACCLSCHLAPAKLVYSLPAFSTLHPSRPSPSVSAVSLIFFS